MKWITHPVVTALSLTNLLLLFLTSPLTSISHTKIEHWHGTATTLFVPVVLVFGLCWLGLSLLLAASGRIQWLSFAVWTAIAIILPVSLLHEWSVSSGRALPLWPLAMAFFFILAVIVLRLVWRQQMVIFLDRLSEVCLMVLGLGVFGALLTILQLGGTAWAARNLNKEPAIRPASSKSTTSGPRIIWIVLDELSYQQVFETRYPGLALPAFDRLANEATVFTNVVPAGLATAHVLPSLLLGNMVQNTGVSADGRMMYLKAESGTKLVFDQHQTVFQDARNAGYLTGVSGWYIPYCRILPGVLDECSWEFNSLISHRSVAEHLRRMVYHFFGGAEDIRLRMAHKRVFDSEEFEDHTEDYVSLMQSSEKLLSDSRIDFVLLHLPVPHPFGIYDRRAGQFVERESTYIDNLALADRTLARIRDQMEHERTWDGSAVIVMGDHSWRTYGWHKDLSWTTEEEKASHGGKFDARPAYIVKLPDQRVGARIDTRFGAIYTRAMLDGIMGGAIRTPGELSAWVSRQPQVASPVAPR